MDALFDHLDTDLSGEIAYSDINSKLRRRIDPNEMKRRAAHTSA